MFSLVLSLLLSLFNSEQFHSLGTYQTSESNIEENVRQEQIHCSRHKIDTKLRVHHRIELACS